MSSLFVVWGIAFKQQSSSLTVESQYLDMTAKRGMLNTVASLNPTVCQTQTFLAISSICHWTLPADVGSSFVCDLIVSLFGKVPKTASEQPRKASFMNSESHALQCNAQCNSLLLGASLFIIPGHSTFLDSYLSTWYLKVFLCLVWKCRLTHNVRHTTASQQPHNTKCIQHSLSKTQNQTLVSMRAGMP